MISTHVLDLTIGKPAAGVRVALSRVDDGKRVAVTAGVTDADGRLRGLAAKGGALDAGTFELAFETGQYFRAHGVESFHPMVLVTIEVGDPAQDYHVPLLVSAFGYTTYRGS